MPPLVLTAPPDPEPLIPTPCQVRARLAQLRVEVRLLARLLRLSEDHCRFWPRPATLENLEARRG